MKSAKETQIKHIRDSEPDRLFMCLDHLQDGDMLVISGSVPASLSADLHERIMKRVQGKRSGSSWMSPESCSTGG